MSVLEWQPRQHKGQAVAAVAAAHLKSESSKQQAPGEVDQAEAEAAAAAAVGRGTRADRGLATTARGAARAGEAKAILLLELLSWLSCRLASAVSATRTGELKLTLIAGYEKFFHSVILR